MFTPVYTLTPALLGILTTIERLYGQLEALRLPKELELNLERKNLIQSAYASNRIEGNPLTMPEVTNLLLDERVPATRSEKEVVNYFLMLQKLTGYKNRPLSSQLVGEIHGELLTGVDETAGKIRNVPVVVGKFNKEKGDVSLRVKHNPPHHTKDEIMHSLDGLCGWVNDEHMIPTVIKSGIFHHQFVYIHPFEDGNGRVCRVLTALVFLRDSYEVNRYFVLDDYYDIDRQQYSDKLHTADAGDKTKWLEYFSEGVMYSLQSALSKARNAIGTMQIGLQPSRREREVLEIIKVRQEVTSQSIAEELKVSRQQAHNLLRSLVEKNLISKLGSTKSSYYKLR